MKTKIFFSAIILVLSSAVAARAQFVEDALRLSQHTGYITARAGGFNVAFHGVSDDFSALAYNPAGLSLVAKSEFSVGFGFTRNYTETEFFRNLVDFNSNNAYITNLGIVVPFKTSGRNASVAIGYFLEDNYNNNLKYDGFNPGSTLISWAAKTSDKAANFPYQYFLTDNQFNTPIVDSLQQNAFIQEKGGLHNIAGGAAFDLSDFVALGFTINGKWGTYNYVRDYEERDILNKYKFFDTVNFKDIDFNRLEYNETLKQDINGITGSLGVQFRFEDFFRAGATVKFPTFYEISEDFSQTASVYLDNGQQVYVPQSAVDGSDSVFTSKGVTSYKLMTPFVYSAGMSLHAANLTFSAGVEYTDATQLEFSDGVKEVNDLNRVILQELVGQTTWGFGVEYEIPLMPVLVRASYSSTTSPYSHDIAGASLKILSFGGGIYLAKNVRLDGLFRWSNVSQDRANFGDSQASKYRFTTSPLDIGMQITYRY